jgi:hypothetical protein
MKKTFGLIRIDAVTLTDLKQAEARLTNRLDSVRKELDGNGARVKLTWGNGNSNQDVERVIGQLKLWFTDQLPEKPRKSWLQKLGDELNSILNEE